MHELRSKSILEEVNKLRRMCTRAAAQQEQRQWLPTSSTGDSSEPAQIEPTQVKSESLKRGIHSWVRYMQ
eukprot:366573-Chlamydomonas_euryale.AAC.15